MALATALIDHVLEASMLADLPATRPSAAPRA
jgi:hypothetical protein